MAATSTIVDAAKAAVGAVTGTTSAPAATDHQTIGADLDTSGPANIPDATTFSTSGAPVQIVPDVDPTHPAIDANPRAGTTLDQNKIDMNDPTIDGAEAVKRNLEAQAKKA